MRCPICLSDSRVEVHGHLQCARCGFVTDPCCQPTADGSLSCAAPASSAKQTVAQPS